MTNKQKQRLGEVVIGAITCLLLLWITSGVSFIPLKMSISYTATGMPAAGIEVTRGRPFTLLEKIYNPIGAFYFDVDEVKTCLTDQNGKATFYITSKKDTYYIYSTTKKGGLTVKMRGHEVQFTPDIKQTEVSNWIYSVRFENGKLKTRQSQNTHYWEDPSETPEK